MIATAHPASQTRSLSLAAARRKQQTDVLSTPSLLPRPLRPRQARQSSRPNPLVIIVSAAQFTRRRPRPDTREPPAIPKSP